MSRSRIVFLLLVLPLLIVAAPASANAVTPSPLDIGSARLVADGAGVRVAFTGTCDAGETAVAGFQTITQAVGNRIAKGSGGVVFQCTGQPQPLSALAVADVIGAPFRVGTALVTATLGWGCCTQVQAVHAGGRRPAVQPEPARLLIIIGGLFLDHRVRGAGRRARAGATRSPDRCTSCSPAPSGCGRATSRTRSPCRRDDQLGELAESFNSMTASIEDLLRAGGGEEAARGGAAHRA